VWLTRSKSKTCIDDDPELAIHVSLTNPRHNPVADIALQPLQIHLLFTLRGIMSHLIAGMALDFRFVHRFA
jgi:hypothetical protein